MCSDPAAKEAIANLRSELREIKDLKLDQRLTRLETYFKVLGFLVGIVGPVVTALASKLLDRIF